MPEAVGVIETLGFPNGKLVTYYIVPNPPENVEAVLPIHYTEDVERFREL